MRLILFLAAALSCCAAANASGDAGLSFDYDTVMQSARMNLLEQTHIGPRSRMHMDSESRRWWDEDCANYSAERSGPIEYKAVRLTSDEHIEYCRDVDVEDSQGHHHHERRCHTEHGDSISKNVLLRIEDRTIFPWEQEKFFFCLKRDELRFGISAAAYKYEKLPSQIDGYPPVHVMTLRPIEKKPMPPDAEGISVEQAGSVEGTARIELADKWWQEYGASADEKTRITFRLMKKNFLFPGATYEETRDFSPSASYTFDFSAANYQMEPGDYYFHCSFARIGKMSTPDAVLMEKTKTFKLRLR